jgi:hypothetical protein
MSSNKVQSATHVDFEIGAPRVDFGKQSRHAKTIKKANVRGFAVTDWSNETSRGDWLRNAVRKWILERHFRGSWREPAGRRSHRSPCARPTERTSVQ